ncbi:MAG: hypothetical protein ACLFVO_21070 [Chloroflexaceae bacterium]
MTSPLPRYDRIASLVLIVVLGLAVILWIDINPNILRARLVGDLPTITVSWLLIASLVVITSAGADLLVRSHPQMQIRTLPTFNLGFMTVEVVPGFWILPAFCVIGSFAFFRLFSASLQGMAFVLALVAAGGLLLAVLVAQHYSLDRDPPTAQRARLVLLVITYLLAFSCFSAIYFTRLRTLYAAPLVGGTATLLAYEVLRWTSRQGGRRLALIIGLVLAETIWALNYWPAPFLLGGTLMLVIFYVTTSLVQHHLAGTLQRRLLVEYGLFGSGLLAALIFATFGW